MHGPIGKYLDHARNQQSCYQRPLMCPCPFHLQENMGDEFYNFFVPIWKKEESEREQFYPHVSVYSNDTSSLASTPREIQPFALSPGFVRAKARIYDENVTPHDKRLNRSLKHDDSSSALSYWLAESNKNINSQTIHSSGFQRPHRKEGKHHLKPSILAPVLAHRIFLKLL
jgi:hypothetical protein